MARLALAAFYAVLAVTLGVLSSWAWAAVILFVVVIPGLAVSYGAALGGEFIAELSRRRFDHDRR